MFHRHTDVPKHDRHVLSSRGPSFYTCRMSISTFAGSKETAFTYAVASAGVLYSVAIACRRDTLPGCGCSEQARPEGLNEDWVRSYDIHSVYPILCVLRAIEIRDNLSVSRYCRLHNIERLIVRIGMGWMWG